MIQQSIGRLVFSMVIRELGFYPVVLPTSRVSDVHPQSSASGWESRELSVLEVRPACGTHFLPYSTAQNSSICLPLAARAWSVESSWKSPERRGETHVLESPGFLCHTLTTVTMAYHVNMLRGSGR